MTKEERGALRLRAVEPEDIDFIYEMENLGFEEGWTDRSAPVSRASIETYVRACDPDPFACGQLRLVCEFSDGMPVALLDFYDISARHRHAKVGIMVAERERRKGYGKRVLRCAAAYARQRLGLYNLLALVGEENAVSRHLFKGGGYEEAGKLRGWWHTHEGITDCIIYQLNL